MKKEAAGSVFPQTSEPGISKRPCRVSGSGFLFLHIHTVQKFCWTSFSSVNHSEM